MVLSRRIDDKEIQLKNQSLIFFQISGAGHEAILVAAGMHLRPGYDWFYPVLSRSRAVPHARRHAARNAPERRRREGRPELRRAADAVALGRHAPQHRVGVEPDRHAVPAGDRLRRSGLLYERVTDDRGTRERFHRTKSSTCRSAKARRAKESSGNRLNAACLGRLPVVYLVEDNGYAISVPVEVQTAGGDISKLVSSFPGLFVQSIDGTDFVASYRAMREAVAYARARNGPAFVHATSRARTRTRCRTTRGCTRRADERAPRRSAIRSFGWPRSSCPKGSRRKPTSRPS